MPGVCKVRGRALRHLVDAGFDELNAPVAASAEQPADCPVAQRVIMVDLKPPATGPAPLASAWRYRSKSLELLACEPIARVSGAGRVGL